jgi:hypothetical protein
MTIAVFVRSDHQYDDFIHTADLEYPVSSYQLVRNEYSLRGLKIEKVV